MCSFRGPTRSCGLQAGTNGGSHEDHGDTKLGSAEECEIDVRYPRKNEILQKFYQRLCPDHHAYGEIVEKGYNISVGRRMSEEPQHIKRKNDNCTYTSVP